MQLLNEYSDGGFTCPQLSEIKQEMKQLLMRHAELQEQQEERKRRRERSHSATRADGVELPKQGEEADRTPTEPPTAPSITRQDAGVR